VRPDPALLRRRLGRAAPNAADGIPRLVAESDEARRGDDSRSPRPPRL